jgi:SAM-dependent methyltransferase
MNARSWREASHDPNSRPVVEARNAAVVAATRRPVPDRIDWILQRCRDRRVIDIGCVDHHVGTHEAATWLHRAIAAVASFCVGVDIEPEGVAAMQAAGYQAVLHDVCKGPGPVADLDSFDVVVAGEVIEHLPAPQALFDFAAAVLRPGGQLVISTPNPYAPHRVRAGQLGVAWENADHAVYAFPSGIVELGERTGFRLEEYRTVRFPPVAAEVRRGLVKLAVETRDRLTGRSRRHADEDVTLAPALEMRTNPFELALVALTRSDRLLGETSLYVLCKTGADSP